MEQKLDVLIEMMKKMDARLERVENDLSSVKKTVEFTQSHLAGVDERLTMTQNIKNLYSEDALKAVEAV